jgi:hypothetical protein
MRKTAAVATGAALTLGAAILAANVATADSDHHSRTIHVVDRDEATAVHDINGDNNLDFGDIVVFRSVVSNPDGKQVGHSIGQIDIQGPHDNLLVYTLVLADGDITMQGDIRGVDPGARSLLAITGGTGRFTGADGVTVARQLDEGATDLVIHLSN